MTQSEADFDRKRNLLLIDDDVSISRALSMFARKYGKVHITTNVEQSLQLLGAIHFDLVITDYELPDGTGLDIVQHLKNQDKVIPMILLTGRGTKEILKSTLNLGIFGFIEKPFVPNELEKMICDALDKQEKQSVSDRLQTLGQSSGSMAHEIVNPLTVIKTYSQLLQNQAASKNLDPDLIRMTESLLKASERIEKIVSDTKSRLRGTEQKDYQSFSLGEVFSLLEEECFKRARSQGIIVKTEGNADLSIHFDKFKLIQVLVNLINNSIEAIGQSTAPWISLEARQDQSNLQFNVTDSGGPIPDRIRDKIFDPLFTTKGTKGTGLGLGIVKSILEDFGGTIQLNLDSPTTQFNIKIPLQN